MNNFDPEIISCFLDEAQDSLVQWERAVLDLEKSESKETLNTLFRAAHNLKGASRAVGLLDFGGFVHRVEDLIHLLLKDHMPVTPGIIATLLEAQVLLDQWVQELRANPEHVPQTLALSRKIESLLLLSPDRGSSALEVPKQNLRSEPHHSEAEDLEAIFAAAQQAYENGAVSESFPQSIPKLAPKSQAPAETMDKGQKSNETVRIPASKMDELIQLVGELTTHQAIIQQGIRSGRLATKICQNALTLSYKLSKDLHTKAMSLRLQPLQSLFQRLERVGRDVARTQGKELTISTEGEDVELDKTVLERMTDPLIHVLRNAVDHGIENSEQRKESGKALVAHVTLSAIRDPAGVCIKISDDGRGLDTQKILQKAREKGLVAPQEQLAESEIFKLIFLPGFSTAEQVTDISGRGVGMDVVMKAIQSLQGSIAIESKLGYGTTFSISIPTSLNIVDALVIGLGQVRYAVPMHELTEIIDLSGFTVQTSANKSHMISLRGDVVPVEKLSTYMPMSRKCQGGAGSRADRGIPALIVRDATNAIAFEVDSILGQQQVVVRPLSEHIAGVPGFSGCTILGDGEPGLIVSLGDIAKSYFSKFSMGTLQ